MARTRVTHVSLRDFRNYERAEVALGDELTVITGPNGAGKTNLLEGIYFGLTGRSCRTAIEREIVRHGAPVARVAVGTAAADGGHTLEVGFEPGAPKRVVVDGAARAGAADLAVRPPASVFLPERLELVKGGPAHRRGHLDRFAAALWPARRDTRAAYSRALSQRNALLTRIRSGSAALELLDPWDAELARHGMRLMADRAAAVELVAPRFGQRGTELGLPDGPELAYRPRSSASTPEELAAELAARRRQDAARGFTGHGPHRDDLGLVHGGKSLRAFGSQGQQRVGLLALLFAERDVLAAHERPPLLLLDDVTSELDGEHRERLAELVRDDGQAVITATDAAHVPVAGDADVTAIAVADGALRATRDAIAA